MTAQDEQLVLDLGLPPTPRELRRAAMENVSEYGRPELTSLRLLTVRQLKRTVYQYRAHTLDDDSRRAIQKVTRGYTMMTKAALIDLVLLVRWHLKICE